MFVHVSIATVTTTQFFVKQEPPEGDIMSTPGRIDSTGMCTGGYLTLFDVHCK